LLDSAGGGLAFWSVGYAFAYGGDSTATGEKTFIGNRGFFMQNDTIRFENWFFQFAFACAVSCTYHRFTLFDQGRCCCEFCDIAYRIIITFFSSLSSDILLL
jgi:Amt family ammonium transporter